MARGLKKIVRSEVSDYADSDVVHLNPIESAPQTVGDLLRTKREEFGAELREAAEYLNIRYTYLLAIEEGRIDNLPGTTYAMGFVRTYADYLGLDGPAIVERYKDETAELGDDIRLVFPSPLPEGKVPSGAIILVAVLSLVLVYAGWVFFAQQNVKFAELVPALPEQFSSLLGSDKTAETSGPTSEARTETAPDAPKSAATEVPPASTPVSDPPPADTRTVGTAAPADTATAATGMSNDTATETPAATRPEPAASAVQAPAAVESAPAESAPAEPAPAREEYTPAAADPGQNTVIRTEAAAAASAVTGSVSEPDTEPPSPVPEQNAAPSAPIAALEDTASVTGSTAAVESTPQATEPPAPAAAPVDQVDTPTTPADEQPAEASVQMPPKPPAVASATPRQYGSEDAESRVVIKARIDSWVQIRDQDGEKLLTRVLREGDSFRVPDRPGLLMETGNAGGLEITVDGAVIPDIGPKGAVRRDVALDAETLKAGTSR